MQKKNFEERLKRHNSEFHPVVPYEQGERLLLMDFTERNQELTDEILNDTELFMRYINEKLQSAGAKYGIGGYNEHRTIYRRSEIFGSPSPTTTLNPEDGAKAPSRWEGDEAADTSLDTDAFKKEREKESFSDLGSPTGGQGAFPIGGQGAGAIRRLHLGIDIWGKPYTKVMAPMDGDLILVPEGYHPVGAAAGYDCYYLNIMAGPARAWHFTIDPDHQWLMDWSPAAPKTAG